MASVPAAGVDEPFDGLVERAARGDEASFARLVRLYQGDMTRVAFVVCGDATLAEESVANAWPVAWRRLSSLREPDRVRPWLCSIAANEARQLLRSRRRRVVAEIRVEAPSQRRGDPGARA